MGRLVHKHRWAPKAGKDNRTHCAHCPSAQRSILGSLFCAWSKENLFETYTGKALRSDNCKKMDAYEATPEEAASGEQLCL